jgi:hypothetical protein
MVEFLNPFTKTTFWVADSRINEYKAAGYPLAADSVKPKVEVKEEPKEEKKETKTVKKPVKKVTKKK